jgi:HAD superfamily hydrolase (TIGR01509 family)
LHENAVCLIGKNVMDLRSVQKKEDDYSIRRPLYIFDLCSFIYKCMDSEYQGLFHFYNPVHKYTKYEICKIIADKMELSVNNIIPISIPNDGIAPRPYDTNLRDDRIDFSEYSFTNFHDSMEKCFSKFKHPKMTVNHNSEIFIIMDMDGTLIDSNAAHYNAYRRVFENRNATFMTTEEWNDSILHGKVDSFLCSYFNTQNVDDIKQEKLSQLKHESICFTKGCESFLRSLIDNEFNFCVVTNASKSTVELFKEKLPLLGEIKQWICREDYERPKPDGQCYAAAKQKYYKNEQYILGIEDSLAGYQSLKSHTDIIYIYDNEAIFKSNDCFLFDDYSSWNLNI